MIKFLSYGGYIHIAVVATLVWLANLIGLLLLWTVNHNTPISQYDPAEPGVLFISSVGAVHKKFFIGMNAATWFMYTLCLFCERWLRHVDRIPGTVRSRERTFDILALCFAFIAGGALTFLGIFDSKHHGQAHWSLTVVFIVCVVLSAIFQTAEVHALAKDHPMRNHLKRNKWIKLFVVVWAVIGAIIFGITYSQDMRSVAAIFEWIIAFVFDIYLATFVLDLWPAAKTSPRQQRRMSEKRLMSPVAAEEGRFSSGSSPESSPPTSPVQAHTRDSRHSSMDSANSSTPMWRPMEQV